MHHQRMPVGAKHSRRQFSHHPLLPVETRVWSKQDGAWGLSPHLTPHIRAQQCGAAW